MPRIVLMSSQKDKINDEISICVLHNDIDEKTAISLIEKTNNNYPHGIKNYRLEFIRVTYSNLGKCENSTLLFLLNSNEKSIELLKEIKRILCSNGIFILDIPHPSYTASNLVKNYEISRKIKTNTLGDVIWSWTRKIDSCGNILTSQEKISYIDENGCKKVKNLLFKFFIYDSSEICSMASDVGLELIKQIEFNDTSGRYHGMLKKRIFFIIKAV